VTPAARHLISTTFNQGQHRPTNLNLRPIHTTDKSAVEHNGSNRTEQTLSPRRNSRETTRSLVFINEQNLVGNILTVMLVIFYRRLDDNHYYSIIPGYSE